MTLLHKVDIIQVDIIQNSIQTAIILHSLWCIIFSYVNKEIILIQVFVIEKKTNLKYIAKYKS